jgi:hypothetical protein
MDNTVAIVAITSGATVVAASIGAVAGQVGLRRQLTAEDQRQRRRLEHERILSDVAELRAMLDEAAQVLRNLRIEVHRPTGPGWVKAGIEAVEPLHSRLVIRLGSRNSVCDAVGSALDAFHQIRHPYASAEPFHEVEDEDDFWTELDALRDQVAYQERCFLQAATATAGARFGTESTP